MPAQKRQKPLYQRGEYKLYRRADRANLEIVWYDAGRGRERSTSAGTQDVEEGKRALDRVFVRETGGEAFCPTCGQPRNASGVLVTTAIADYLMLSEEKSSFSAIRPRLNHVLDWIEETGRAGMRCRDLDTAMIERFRKWLVARPIMLPGGNSRPRSLSTVENSVLQLAAAINECGGVKAGFRASQPKEVNQTPTYRADMATLVRMFRWCLYPTARTAKETERRIRERANLLAFLRISVATMARPDAAHDVSTDPKRQQWHSVQRVLNLNPAGRRQTRKYRATVPVARQMAPLLDNCDGMMVPVASVANVWASMAKAIGLPGNGQAGVKLIRRSIANMVRQRLAVEHHVEVSMFLGHDKFDGTSDLYAPFSPDYLRRALSVIEQIIEEIEAGCSGAFHREVTANSANVIRLGAAKNG